MNYIDIFIIIPVIWFAYQGFRRGFIIELASLLALILGIYAAISFSGFASDFLENLFNIGKKYLPVISFIVTFVIVVVLFHLLGRILEKFVNMIALGFLNKFTGACFGILKAVLFTSIILMLINRFNDKLIPEEKKENSLLYKPVALVAPWLLNQLEYITWDGFDRIKKEVDEFET